LHDIRRHVIVSNTFRGYHFYSVVGTSPKYVSFSEVVPAPVRVGFFSRINLTTRLFRPKLLSAGRVCLIPRDQSCPPASGKV
jgi:hypothetical protein